MIFLQLLIGHAVADYALQSDWMAKAKNRHHKTEPPPGQTYQPCWFWVLSAHAFIHGGAVYVVTGSPWLAMLEIAVHWMIDFWKCEGAYGINVDQTLHIVTKLFITTLYFFFL